MLRHLPADPPGRLYGRTDAPLAPVPPERLDRLRGALGDPDIVITSPARRCRDTLALLWPDRPPDYSDMALWEQDFGAWDGRPTADLPDLGPLDADALAAWRGHGGESFDQLSARAVPAFEAALARDAGGCLLFCVHAGTIRALLAHLLDARPALGLRFRLSPGSLTRLSGQPATGWAVDSVNLTP